MIFGIWTTEKPRPAQRQSATMTHLKQQEGIRQKAIKMAGRDVVKSTSRQA